MIYEERQYQSDVVRECVARFTGASVAGGAGGAGGADGKCDSVMIEAPVGSGKTIMALRVIDELERALGRRLKVAWVAPRHHLLEQVMRTNMEFRQAVIRPVSLFEKNPPPADLMVLDEAHHEATRSCLALYDRIRPALTLGLSATPMRTDRMKLSFKATVNSCGIRRLIVEGYLAPFHSHIMPHYDWLTAAEVYLAAPERWGKSVVFFETIRECEAFQRRLAEGGVACEVVTSESARDEQLEAFRTGKIKVVANAQMLAEGFDLPDIQSVFVRDGTRLPVIQMCGRGLRKCEGKTHCNIVQSANTSFTFERVATPENAFRLMYGEWLSLTDKTAQIAAMLENTLRLIAQKEQRKRQATQQRQSSAMHDFEGHSPPASTPGRGRGFYRENRDLLLALYRGYDLINAICWEGKLPQVAIGFNLRRNNRRVGALALAFATNGAGTSITHQGKPLHRITLNVHNLLKVSTDNFANDFWGVFTHEMIHIWQFATGKRGGHGKDFYAEGARIGYDEKSRRIDGLFLSILPSLAKQSENFRYRFHNMLMNPSGQTKSADTRFFFSEVAK